MKLKLIRILLFCAVSLLSFSVAQAQDAPPPAKTVEIASAIPLTASLPAPSPSPAPATKATEGKTAKPKSGIVLPPEKANPVRLNKFDKPPVIDGKLDDDVWKQATVFKDFYQIGPGDNIAPSKPTEIFIGYDAKFLYLAARAVDEPDKIRATVARRDNVFGEDNVRFFLDTFNDQRKAYVLGFNPLGVQQDGILTEGVGTDFSVDIVMESKGLITADGWTVEVAIPFKSLRYEAGKDKLWGFHVWRNIDRFNDEMDSWMPISRDKTGTMSQAGHITGLEGISTERTLEIIPSLTISETGKRIPTFVPEPFPSTAMTPGPGRFTNKGLDLDPGLTMKYVFSPNATLDLAVNPDFAQVEADATVVQVNQRFPIFFQEKRPFFLEGIDIFQTPLQPVHTRAIVDPDLAVKLSGKRGRNTFGIMLASDAAPGNFSEEEQEDPDPDVQDEVRKFGGKNAYIGVIRLKRDIGRENSLGLIATTYNFIERHNNLAGLDGRFKFNPTTFLTFQALGTTTQQYFEDEAGNTRSRTAKGLGYYWNLDMTGRHWGYSITGQGRTQDYRAFVGFTRRVNTNFQDVFIRYSTEPNPKATLISVRFFNSLRGNYDWQGRLQNLDDEAQVQFTLARTSYAGFGFVRSYERIFAFEFGDPFFGESQERSAWQNSPYFFAGTTPSKKYSLNIFAIRSSNAFDLDFGGGDRFPRVSPSALLARQAEREGLCNVDPQPDICLAKQDPGTGSYYEITGGILYKPTSAWSASLDYTKTWLVRNDTGLTAFDDNIYSLRTTYQFTRFIFARARVDYETITSRMRPQLLLGWTPNPGTALYVGYNDDLNRNGFNPFTGNLEPGFRRNGRTFFIKMSYLFRRSF